MEYFLGIDIGTTSVKTIAFSREGKTIAEKSIGYPISHPFPDWSEQDPSEIFKAVCETVENILQELTPHLPVLCSFCSAMHSLIVMDVNGNPISASIIWADNRAVGSAEKIHAENKAWPLYQRTGLPVHAMSPFCKLLWLKENQNELFDRAYKFIGIKEFIFHRLFNTWVVDVSMAAATGLMNLVSLQWDPWVLKEAGIGMDRLSQIVETGKIFFTSFFPALKNIPFVIGGSDGAMANLGATDEPGTLVVTVGTSSAARLIVKEPRIDPGMRSFCYYISEGSWLMGGASNNGGIVLQWLQENYFRSDESVSDFLAQASRIRAGSDGLIFLPYLLGERAPVWNARARGVLFGLQIQHGQAEMIRASLEAVIYCLLGVSQPLFEQADIRKIIATGGFARNELWLQILSDMFNLPVLVSESVENSAWGAVKCGMKALNIPSPEYKNPTKIFSPDAAAHAIYSRGFQQFQRIYSQLKNEFI
jgi:gluconokinase